MPENNATNYTTPALLKWPLQVSSGNYSSVALHIV